ncbi:hypothetical protein GQX74_009701 [Glossina fuscipes]|nr:hypothetical protein GQX74_009701 [Glossina fuscipes]
MKKVNLLEDTFQPITKPLKRIIKKLDNKDSTPLTSSFTNDSIENRNNGGDEGVNGDDDDNVNNIDYKDAEVEADNDVEMGNQEEEEEVDFHNEEEDMNIGESSLETSSSLSSGNTPLLNNNNNNTKNKNRFRIKKSLKRNIDKKGLKIEKSLKDPKDAVTKAYLLRKNYVLTDRVNNLTTTCTSKLNRIEDDMRQFQNSYDSQMNSMKKQIDELYTTIKNDINSEAKQVEITLKNQLINANKTYMNKIEERFDKIEEYIFKWIGVEQLQEKYDKQLNSMREALETKDNDYLLKDQGDATTLTTSTTILPPVETPTTQQEKEQTSLKYFSVDDAIEAFRRSLINSEMDIGGIVEAEKPFYRHFNLKYENFDIPIRCTYKSIYEQREIKINCFECREFEKERILSNGEIGNVRTPDLSRRLQDIRIVGLKDYTQTYKMNIT